MMKIRKRTGLDHKGLGIAMLGLTWILLGIGVFDERHVEYTWHHDIPLWIRITVWVCTGLFALASAWYRPIRPWAFFLLVISPGLRFFSYLTAWIIYLIPNGYGGLGMGWAYAAIHLIMIGFVFYLADMGSDSETIEELNSALREDGDHA